jgi:hypothetical protein
VHGASDGAGDYANPLCAEWKCDDPASALHAIAQGDLSGFFRFQPAMGLTSLALRAPAVALAHEGGAGIHGEYTAGAAVCLAGACALAVWLAWFMHRGGARLVVVLSGLALWVTAILAGRALLFGHPEEPLAATLALAAIVMAWSGHPLAAGALIGLAIGTKEWALLVAPAVVFAGAAPDWRRIGAAALVAVALTTGVMAVGNPTSFKRAHEEQRAGDERTLSPATIWYRVGDKHVVSREGDQTLFTVYPPKLIGRWCRPFVMLLAVIAALLFVRRRGFRSPDVFALAAFVLLARVVFDTQTFSYHLVPMLVLVTAWEAIGRRRLPVVGLAATVAFLLTAYAVASSSDISSYGFNAIYLAWTLPLLAYLGYAAGAGSGAGASP